MLTAGTANAGNAAALVTRERRDRFDIAFPFLGVCVNAPARRNAAQYFCYYGFGHGAPTIAVRCGKSRRVATTSRRDAIKIWRSSYWK